MLSFFQFLPHYKVLEFQSENFEDNVYVAPVDDPTYNSGDEFDE